MKPVCLLGLTVLLAGQAAAASPDSALPSYLPQAVVPPTGARYLTPDGAIAIIGYNDMQGILERMDALFARFHPGFRFKLTLKGTRTAPAALARGLSAFAPMGAEFLPDQLAAYEKATGSAPLDFRVAHASLDPRARSGPIGIFVARRNPLDHLTVAQVQAVFASAHPPTTWGQLGAIGPWARQPIHPYGLSAATALGDYMLRRHFRRPAFAGGFTALGESADVVARVGRDPAGIGFAALNRGTSEVKALAIAAMPGGKYSRASVPDLQAGRYAYDRFLHLFVRPPIEPWVREYLRLVLSREGQAIVAAAPPGYIPLGVPEAAVERARLN